MFTKSIKVVITALVNEYALFTEEFESQFIMNCKASFDCPSFNFKSIGIFSSIEKLKKDKTIIHFKQKLGTILIGIKSILVGIKMDNALQQTRKRCY